MNTLSLLASCLFSLSLCMGFSGDRSPQKPIQVKRGVGFLDLKIGSSKLKHVEEAMSLNYQSAVFNYSASDKTVTTLDYEELGIRFQFSGKGGRSTLDYIYLEHPFDGSTVKGIKIGENSMNEVEKAYGYRDWKISGQDLYKEYSGIAFYVRADRRVGFQDLDHQLKLDHEFADHKVYKIILSGK